MYSLEALSGCVVSVDYGKDFWTAGQQIMLTYRSLFVWRVTSTDANSDTVTAMSYTNWYTGSNRFISDEDRWPCMNLRSRLAYTWTDNPCHYECCSVCELDI